MASHTHCSHAYPAIARGRVTLPIASFLNGLQEFSLISLQHSFFEAFPSSLQSFHRRLLSLCLPQTGHLSKSLPLLPGSAVLLSPCCSCSSPLGMRKLPSPLRSLAYSFPPLNYYSSFLCRCTHTFGCLLGDAEIIQKQQQLPRAWIQEQPPSSFPRSLPGDVSLFYSVIWVFETPGMWPQGKTWALPR